ncbi:MAG: hypothetical protein RLZZ450_3603 [Pseudomonadota bacterium]|jgi:peptide/nickel transport system permease protein
MISSEDPLSRRHVLTGALGVLSGFTLLGCGKRLLSVSVGELLSGTVVMETLFARQGIGRVAVEALNQKDMPVVQGAILLASVTYVLINLAVDLSYAWIDPRTRLVEAGGSR